MTENRICFTFIWKIKNFSLSYSKSCIRSPVFIAQPMENIKWRLVIYPNSINYENCVAVYLEREVDNLSLVELEIVHQLSFLAVDGSVLHSQEVLMKVYKQDFQTKLALHLEKNQIYIFKKDLFIPYDILTIRCRMWEFQKSDSLLGRCFAKTQIETKCESFIGTIENFSSKELNEKHPFNIEQSTENFHSFMNLCVNPEGSLQIEIRPAVCSPFSDYKCKLFILDAFRNKIEIGKDEFYDKNSQHILLTLRKDYLIAHKTSYLPHNVLTVECKVIYSPGKTIDNIDVLEYKIDDIDSLENISNEIKTKLPTEEYYPESLTTLKDDLNTLFMEGILCDTKLKIGTETFPVHKAVLIARSPVFKTMLTTDMKEKTNNCVDIDDLDADTVRRMLKFMYLDTLDDLEYESAKSLYFAADKYSILSLKYGCFKVLKQNILPTNCCDVLLLADKHQDEYLKTAVQDYIVSNDEVLLSEEWKNLEKNHPQLTTEVFRALYMKNREF